MSEDRGSVDVGSSLSDTDGELKAIHTIVEALKPLTDPERRRALEYVLGRFGVPPLTTPISEPLPSSASYPPAALPSNYIEDIRSLKESKAPKSAIEMAALVAYYVSELAPASERAKQINKADIERYFKLANFKLPSDAAFTLVNAKNAGYLDTAGSGQYALNPVGYNLVVHRLGMDDGQKKAPQRGAKKKVTVRRKK
jgi:hypothetical protein